MHSSDAVILTELLPFKDISLFGKLRLEVLFSLDRSLYPAVALLQNGQCCLMSGSKSE